MAGGSKKKKKPAANPARGFATTSIVSKAKEEKAPETSNDTSETNSAVATPASLEKEVSQRPSTVTKSTEKELHELSPDELEAQLEHSDLQNAVDQLGPKARKESSRQINRLQTDRRVLRSQAESLNVREWLPDEIMQHIIELTAEESFSSAAFDAKAVSAKAPSEDIVLIRIWQLYIVLKEIDVSEQRVSQALQHILSAPPLDEASGNVWGLNEVLDWLALHSDAGELLEYEAVKPKARVQDNVLDKVVPDDETDDITSPRKANQRQMPASGARENLNGTESEPEVDLDVSDLESDIDPDEMLSTYLRTKMRLFEHNPESSDGLSLNGSRKKHGRPPGNGITSRLSMAEKKMQQKLQALEADILFDKQLADARWQDQRTELLRTRAERKRLGLEDASLDQRKKDTMDKKSTLEASNNVMDEAEELGRKLLEEADADDADLLSGMFDTSAGAEDSSIKQGEPLNGSDVVIRNFGKISGLSPRRVLEDACRSRDSGAKVQYKMISPTTYSCRHSVTVSWSKDQEPVVALDLPALQLASNDRSTVIRMIKIAAPDTDQSVGFASTVALFLLFSNSPKDEKVALRLPPTFRDLWQEMSEARKEQVDRSDRELVKTLRRLMTEQKEKDDDEDVILTAGLKNRSKAASGVNTPSDSTKPLTNLANNPSQEIIDLWTRKTSNPAYQHMLAGRINLPMFQFREMALSVVRKNQVTILCGETGCGKSTQMPAFVLEDELSQGRECKIYCTEPRRISAISLAQRVSEEMGEGKGAAGTNRSLVGYAIRLESQTSASTRLVYATVGIVLRMLESAKGLRDITHLVIDEIHERSIDTDFLLIVLRSLMVRRPDLKVILMSATVDAQRFSQYLDNAPIVTVPGRTFPVKAMFLEDAIEHTGHTNEESSAGNRTADNGEDDDELEDGSSVGTENKSPLSGYSPKTVKTLASYDEYKIDYVLIQKLLEMVAYQQDFTPFSKAILVFLPGLAEIRQLNDMLCGHPSFAQGWLIYPLHSTFSSEEQQAAFQVPPPGIRKIVLATNIAETGITIPDVTCVIDTGKHKEMRFDERRQLSRLIQSFISRANAKQRRGRAGRVQEGICFHLFTKHRHDEIMAEQQTPEMLRLSLQDLVMRVKICKLGDIEQALSSALDPPSLKNIRRAIDALIEVNALTNGEELTPLGSQLAKLPLDAQLGKLILLATSFGCLDAALTIAAVLSSKSPFLSPLNAQKQAESVRLGFKRGDSDLLTAYNAYIAWRRVCTTPGGSEFQFCKKNFLSQQNLANIEDLKGQLLASLADAGFVSLDSSERTALSRVRNSGRHRTFVPVPPAKNHSENNDLLINSVTAWSFYPKVLSRVGKGWSNIANNQSISLHRGSVNKNASQDHRFLSFYSIMQSSSRFTNAQETSPVSEMALVLLAGDAVFHMYAGVVVIDGNRLRFKVRDWKTMLALKTLRSRIRDILAKGYKTPGRALTERQDRWMQIFVEMFQKVEKNK